MKLGTSLIIGGALFALAIFVGLLAPWLAHSDPVMDANLMNAEEPPSWTWWFGTDAQGRDIYSRVVHGARISLTVGIVSQLINSVIGVVLGLAGTRRHEDCRSGKEQQTAERECFPKHGCASSSDAGREWLDRNRDAHALTCSL